MPDSWPFCCQENNRGHACRHWQRYNFVPVVNERWSSAAGEVNTFHAESSGILALGLCLWHLWTDVDCFRKMCNSASCLHHRLPPPRSTSVISTSPLPNLINQKISVICKFSTQQIPITYTIPPIPPVVSLFFIMDYYCYYLHLYFSALMDSVVLHLRTVLLHFCCTVCTALLFSYSTIFITTSVWNKLIVIV